MKNDLQTDTATVRISIFSVECFPVIVKNLKYLHEMLTMWNNVEWFMLNSPQYDNHETKKIGQFGVK